MASRSALPIRRRSIRRLRAVFACAVLAAAGLVSLNLAGSAAGSPSVTPAPASPNARHDVIANLFEWNWVSVARECTTVLGPAGYGGVQVAPPQDSLKRTALGNGSDTILHPWWEVYQPVDYNLTSRMGNEAQFKSMVATCRAAGVKVYVDAVINHMTGQGNLSYGGVSYTKYDYAGLYGPQNFHHYPADCPVPPGPGSADLEGSIQDFNDYTQVFHCELLGLADLRTDTDYVRNTLAAYLNKLIGYGVSGFRVDAAKHIGQTDLAAIAARLHRTADNTPAYLALEVFGGGPGVLSPFAFQSDGSLLGLDADVQIKNAFKSYNSPPNDGNIGDLRVFGEGSGLVPSSHELSFVQNHDTERNGDALNYKDGATNLIASEFLLAYGYGRPEVYASFAWNTSDDSPPSDGNGMITDTDCASSAWVCIDRDPGVAHMVGWHNHVDGTPVTNWWDDGQNLIAFSRGHKGWIAINNETTPRTRTFTTGLAAGTYCDIIHGNLSNGRCTGPTIDVNAGGSVTVTVAAKDAVAIDLADQVS
jgi:alpha-amylase